MATQDHSAPRSPYYSDDSVILWHGDALTILRDLPSGSVNCVVTSPPYFGLRDYGVAGQLGAEPSPAEYVTALVAVLREARRVLADDGTLWLNLGDSYSTYAGNRGPSTGITRGRDPWQAEPQGAGLSGDRPAKNLMGIPWRVAFALQDDGWTLRNDIIWAKPNGMPESVTDRLSTKHEHVFMLAKSRRYWFDLDAIREPQTTIRPHALDWSRDSKEADVPGQTMRQHRASRHKFGGLKADGYDNRTYSGREYVPRPDGKNPGDVWTIPTAPFPGAHFATMPSTLAERCILAGCKPGGVVLDPFSGSGTTGLAATKHGQRYVGIDLNAEYLALSLRTRLAQGTLIDGGGAA